MDKANAAVRSLEFHSPLELKSMAAAEDHSLIGRLLFELHMEPRQQTGLYDCFHCVLQSVIVYERLLARNAAKATKESVFPEKLFGLRVRGMHLLRQVIHAFFAIHIVVVVGHLLSSFCEKQHAADGFVEG